MATLFQGSPVCLLHTNPHTQQVLVAFLDGRWRCLDFSGGVHAVVDQGGDRLRGERISSFLWLAPNTEETKEQGLHFVAGTWRGRMVAYSGQRSPQGVAPVWHWKRQIGRVDDSEPPLQRNGFKGLHGLLLCPLSSDVFACTDPQTRTTVQIRSTKDLRLRFASEAFDAQILGLCRVAPDTLALVTRSATQFRLRVYDSVIKSL